MFLKKAPHKPSTSNGGSIISSSSSVGSIVFFAGVISANATASASSEIS